MNQGGRRLEEALVPRLSENTMSAKYLVTVPPGAPVPGVGFVRNNDAFLAPAGFIPSRTFKPLNAEASAELQKLKDAMLARAKQMRATEKDVEAPEVWRSMQAGAKSLEAQAAAIDITVFEVPVEEAKVERNVAAPSPVKGSRKI